MPTTEPCISMFHFSLVNDTSIPFHVIFVTDNILQRKVGMCRTSVRKIGADFQSILTKTLMSPNPEMFAWSEVRTFTFDSIFWYLWKAELSKDILEVQPESMIQVFSSGLRLGSLVLVTRKF